MSFILSPNLPQNRVTHVILGSKYKKTAERLNKINISVIQVPDNKGVLNRAQRTCRLINLSSRRQQTAAE
jgi:hypothetical protein